MIQQLLEGKVALVTGATRNVGKGIAYRFAREGAHVFLNGRNKEAVNCLVESWKNEGLSVEPAIADASDSHAMQKIIENAFRKYQKFDILVNNVIINVNKGEKGPFLKVTAEGWQQFMSLNLNALFFNSQNAAKIMAKQRCGSIINISSNGAILAHRQRIAYDSLKGALEAFTRAIAIDLAPWKVRVNALRLCAISEAAPEGSERAALHERLGAMIPLGRIARPEDAAWAAVFLAADASDFVTGQCINIDGGMLEQSRPPQLELEPVFSPEELEL